MPYLITGGCGFIGSHIAQALVNRGEKVRILDNLSTGYLTNIDDFIGSVEMVQGDITELSHVEKAMENVQYVFHEAAIVSVFDSIDRPRITHDINVTGTFNVLEAAVKAGVKRVVMASSSSVYGNDPQLPKSEEMPPAPESPYAVSKLCGELNLMVYAKRFGLETIALRYFNVYGPRQDPSSMYSGVISKFVDAIIKKEPPTIFGDGTQTRDFVNVKDVVQANLTAMDSPDVGAGEVFNIGTGKQVSLLALYEILAGLSNSTHPPVYEKMRAGDVKHSTCSIEKAKNMLYYQPQVNLEAGLAQLLKWSTK